MPTIPGLESQHALRSQRRGADKGADLARYGPARLALTNQLHAQRVLRAWVFIERACLL